MFIDLLSIRADHDSYYHGLAELFRRHNDIVKVLCDSAPVLWPTFLDGLCLRSRFAVNGSRRCNYHVKHPVVDVTGNFAKTLEWIAKAKDSQIVCHRVVTLVSETVWNGVAHRTFLSREVWLTMHLSIFMIAYAIMVHSNICKMFRILTCPESMT